ncbi:hypothetical protein ACN28S_19565 [Cystobacter fuscus]
MFLRLVSDADDDAASGNGVTSDPNNQTILVKLGDKVEAAFNVASCAASVRLPVGRPAAENDNGANPRLHDIRTVFAGGYSAGVLLNPPTAHETAILAYKDSNANTIDVFYVERLLNSGGRGTSYPKARNQSGNPLNSNWVVMSSATAGGGYPNTLAHELMHVLLDTAHRPNEPATALFRGGTTPNKSVGGTKRIGPYPGAASAGVGNSDVTVIRANAETLP